MPRQFSLFQNFPNPFNPTTDIRFSLLGDGPVSLEEYDLLAHEVVILFERQMEAGSCSTSLEGGDILSGAYFYRLAANGVSEVRNWF